MTYILYLLFLCNSTVLPEFSSIEIRAVLKIFTRTKILESRCELFRSVRID